MRVIHSSLVESAPSQALPCKLSEVDQKPLSLVVVNEVRNGIVSIHMFSLFSHVYVIPRIKFFDSVYSYFWVNTFLSSCCKRSVKHKRMK